MMGSVIKPLRRLFQTARSLYSAHPHIKRHALSALDLAGALGQTLPNKEDTVLTSGLKTLGAASVIRKIYFPATASPLAQYARQYGLVRYDDASFVRIFFGTKLRELFTIGQSSISDYVDMYIAKGDLGHFVFTKSTYAENHDSIYYTAPKINLSDAVQGLWLKYDGRLHANIVPSGYGQTLTEYDQFAVVETPLFGDAAARLARLRAVYFRCKAQGVQRSYMFHGPPGTGKTSFAMRLADELGEKTLKMNAAGLACVSVKELGQMLRHLAPDFLIVDDVDKVQAGNALPSLLEIVQQFKLEGGHTSLILTANAVSGFDKGLLRPGRIDTWLEFKLPELGERKAVITSYAEQLGVEISVDQVSDLADKTDTLSHDYLRELVTELRQCGSFDETIALALLQKNLLALATPPAGAAPELKGFLVK